MLPKANKLPCNTYRAKKLIAPLALDVQKVHACLNHCVLYRKEYVHYERYSVCKRSRYKRNDDCEDEDDSVEVEDTASNARKKRKIPTMVMWYLPVIARLKRLFSNPRDSELMSWHFEQAQKKTDEMLRHPLDGSQWRKIDTIHPRFGDEPRNVRFALSTDGMNPFGDMSSSHSTWPVVLSILNIPSWLCMKRKYLMLSILIQGPKQPGNDIDVFLEPLLEDMAKLWNDGELVWDEFKQECFTLRAMIFVAITDYPGGFSLSGQMKGKKGCLVCLGDTQYVYLFGSKKLVYMRSRRFLPPSHRYRKMRKEFDGTEEKGRAPKHLEGKLVFELVKNIKVVFGKKVPKGKENTKKRKKTTESVDQTKETGGHEEDATGFKKLSIFFKYLPYWKDLDIRHAIDVMHVEKNVCDSILGILLDIKGKTKEGLKSRKDFVDLNIRHELHPEERANGKYYLPAASYNLTTNKKRQYASAYVV